MRRATGTSFRSSSWIQRLWKPPGRPRQTFLIGCLSKLNEALDGNLVVRHGNPATVMPKLAAELGASSVHVAADTGPYGRRRDEAVATALAGTELVSTGSAYAVTPGRLKKADGEPYRVFTPYAKAWRAHGWRQPAITPRSITWSTGLDSDRLPPTPERAGPTLPTPGEAVARQAWQAFREVNLAGYPSDRNRPDLDRTSQLSPYLHFGCIHPRTVLADIPDRPDRPGLAARMFVNRHLVDCDLASNQHGWQWVAAAVPTPRRTTGCSTRSCRARSSTRTVTT